MSLCRLISSVLAHEAVAKYKMGEQEGFSIEMKLYRDGLVTYCTTKSVEGLEWHVDGPSVDNENFPIVHIYLNNTAQTDTALVGIRPISDKRNKKKEIHFPASHASMTLLLPGADKVVQHSRHNRQLAPGEVAMTLVLRVASADGMKSARRVAPDAHDVNSIVDGFTGGKQTGRSNNVCVIATSIAEPARQPEDAEHEDDCVVDERVVDERAAPGEAEAAPSPLMQWMGEVVWARSPPHNYWPGIVVPCNGRCTACAESKDRLCIEFFPDEAAGYSCLRVSQLLPWEEGLERRLEFEPAESVEACDYNVAVSTATSAAARGFVACVTPLIVQEKVGVQDTGSIDIHLDWASPEDSRILFDRCITSPVLYDKSICAILAAHAEAGILTFVHRSRDDRWSPGDVFARASVLPLIGIEPHSFPCAVKGSEAAGGAVSLFLSKKCTKRTCVELQTCDWDPDSDCIVINYDGGRTQRNQTLLKESLRTQKPARCMAPLNEYAGSRNCMAYLGDARVVHDLGDGHWMLKFGMTAQNEAICQAWMHELE